MGLASFDAASYLAANSDLLKAGFSLSDAEQHYLAFGQKEGRPTTFDSAAYLASNSDLRSAFETDTSAALQHYIASGWKENRSISFNAAEYLASNRDLLAAGLTTQTAAQHYINFGANENRSLTSFDASAYLAANTDLSTALKADASAALQHYVTTGWQENRATMVKAVEAPSTESRPTDVTPSRPPTPVEEIHFQTMGFFDQNGASYSGFRMQAGQKYLVEARGKSTGGGTLADPYVEGGYLTRVGGTPVGPSGSGITSGGTLSFAVVASDDNGGTGLDAKLIFTAPETALFNFRVLSKDSTFGSYTLSVNSI